MKKQFINFIGPVFAHKPSSLLVIIWMIGLSVMVLYQASNLLFAYIFGCITNFLVVGSLFHYIEDNFEKKKQPNDEDEKKLIEG
ncbi:MAG: hypothetical protein HRT53_17490 [Colwellia sp.]|nr:hypothetical protein [Colwellia sp.]